ncbi:MAG: photosystem reaction center subunit H [Cyanobacteria bacterium P01_A01_bin.83]
MMNVIRFSQIVGLMAMDSSTASKYDCIEEVWLDESGRVVYLGGRQGYTPIEQISVVGDDAVLTYSNISDKFEQDLFSLNQMQVSYPKSDPLGWVEDFLFDWSTGDITAYILGGDIAESFGGRAVLFPDDIETIDAEAIVIKEEAKDRLQSETEGLKGFISEKSQQVKHLVHKMNNRLRSLIHPQDEPEVVHIKIREVSDELAESGKHDRDVLKEATEFLQDKWQELQQSISRNNHRMRSALDSAWKKLVHE